MKNVLLYKKKTIKFHDAFLAVALIFFKPNAQVSNVTYRPLVLNFIVSHNLTSEDFLAMEPWT